MLELRCGGTMHGRMEDNLLEVKCSRRSCGVQPGVVVLHTFDVTTGKLVNTTKYASPPKEGMQDGTRNKRSSIRSA